MLLRGVNVKHTFRAVHTNKGDRCCTKKSVHRNVQAMKASQPTHTTTYLYGKELHLLHTHHTYRYIYIYVRTLCFGGGCSSCSFACVCSPDTKLRIKRAPYNHRFCSRWEFTTTHLRDNERLHNTRVHKRSTRKSNTRPTAVRYLVCKASELPSRSLGRAVGTGRR